MSDDMLINREHALARERELEAEIQRLTERIVSDQQVLRQMELEIASLKYQIANSEHWRTQALATAGKVVKQLEGFDE